MATKKYTSYIKATYKKKDYFIRGWISYTINETESKKTFKFTAGFNTKTRACSLGDIVMNVSSNKGDSVTAKKAFKGTSASTSIKYCEGEWTWDTSAEGIKITLKGSFSGTRFSGKTVSMTLGMVGDKMDFEAERVDGEDEAVLTFTVNRGVTGSLTEPVIRRKPVNSERQKTWDTITGLEWYHNGTKLTFPYSVESIPFTMTATDDPDGMHMFKYRCTCAIGITNFDGYSDDINAASETDDPLWYVTYSLNMTKPEVNHDGKAILEVYARDNRYMDNNTPYGSCPYTLIPDDNGWEIEEGNNGYWSVTIPLTDQYVADWESATTQADIQLKWSNFVSNATVNEKSRAIYNTNRNANFSTGLANNVFIGGCTSTEFSSRVWYSAVNNPLYFPDLNYIEVGSTDTRVMGMTKVGDYLGVVKQSNTTDTSVYLVYPTSFDDNTTFATKPCAGGVGAIGEYCFNVLGDETLFLSPRGVMAIEPQEDEQSRIKDRSYFVNGLLLKEPHLGERAYSFVYDGFYLLAVNNNVYVLDGSQRNSWGNQKTNLVYECYYLENVPAKCMFTYADELWFSDDKGNLCRFKSPTEADAYTDDGTPVSATWSTIADDDGALQYYKNLEKKGCLVSLLPEEGTTATITIVKDEGKGEKNGKEIVVYPTGSLPVRKLPTSLYTKKKIKKYKRLRFIVTDNTANPFGVDKIIKSYTLGSYAKK